jgi:hypothetical protein
MAKGGKGGLPVRTVENFEAVVASEMIAAAPNCAQFASLATTGLGKGGHMGYNAGKSISAPNLNNTIRISC